MKRRLTKNPENSQKLWRSFASDLLRKLKERSIFVNLGDSSISLCECESIRAISETVPESPTRNLLLKCLLDAEQQSAGGSFVALSEIARSKNLDLDFGHRFSVDDLRKSLLSLSDQIVSDIVVDSISIAGRNGKIVLDSSDVQKTEITYGTQSCRWHPPSDFFAAAGQSKIAVQNCKIVFIDGIIESVSECHRIFQDSYDKKIPVVIFARGFNEEVIATSAVNIKRQTARVVPVVIPFDEVGVNGMADLANCFGAEPVSADKGQLISSVDLDSCVAADQIVCNLSSTEIEFKENRVSNVVSRLASKLSSCDQDQSDLIRRRLGALGSGLVTIKIGADKKSLSGIQRDRVDFGLRYAKSCMSSGVVNYSGTLLPFSALKAGTSSSKSFISILTKCSTILEVDKCG